VIITASTTNECQFCTYSHCDLVDIADIVKDPLIVIEHPEGLVPRERLAIEYTRAMMVASNAIPAPLAQQLHEHFSDPELVELTFLIGYINMLNLFNNGLQVRYDGEYAILKPSAG
jgi:alkylhydroperoxidase family enzyme